MKGFGKTAIWDVKRDTASSAEGWSIFNADGLLQIQRIDDPEDGSEPVFAHDGEAYKFVTEKALKGSKLHLLALYLDGRSDTKDIQVPRLML